MKHRRIKKSIREIQTNINYSGERSPYWDFLSSHQHLDADGQMQEDSVANPDMLSENDCTFKKSFDEEKEFRIQIVKEIIPMLSTQQQKLLNLCGVEGLSLKDAAKKLNITSSTAQVFLQRARGKILRYYTNKRTKAIADGEL